MQIGAGISRAKGRGLMRPIPALKQAVAENVLRKVISSVLTEKVVGKDGAAMRRIAISIAVAALALSASGCKDVPSKRPDGNLMVDQDVRDFKAKFEEVSSRPVPSPANNLIQYGLDLCTVFESTESMNEAMDELYARYPAPSEWILTKEVAEAASATLCPVYADDYSEWDSRDKR